MTRFPDDVERLVRFCAMCGVFVTPDQVERAWERYQDERVFAAVEEYLPGGVLVVDAEDESGRCQKCHDVIALPGLSYCLSCTRMELDWVRQTIHRASHEGPLEGCLKNTCDAIRKLLGDE